MTRHIADHRSAPGQDKTRAFLDIERKAGPHPAILALTRQPRAPRKADKTIQFLRIDRQQAG